MALTLQQQNFCTDLMQYSRTLLTDAQAGESLKARWFNNSFSNIANADLAAYPPTAHLTQAKLAAALTAIESVLTALGDDSSGQQVNLIETQG